MKKLLLILLSVTLIFSCAEKKEKNETTNPTKELMINTLYKLHDELKNKNYDNSIKYIIFTDSLFLANRGVEFTDTVRKRLISSMSRLIELNEISERGIQILSSDAVFGKVTDVYQDIERRKRQIERLRLIENQCFGLYIENTGIEVMAVWRNNKFLFYKLDNIGKLEIQ